MRQGLERVECYVRHSKTALRFTYDEKENNRSLMIEGPKCQHALEQGLSSIRIRRSSDTPHSFEFWPSQNVDCGSSIGRSHSHVPFLSAMRKSQPGKK